VYFMSTACGRPQGGSGSCGQGEGESKIRFFVDIRNGWSLHNLLLKYLPVVVVHF